MQDEALLVAPPPDVGRPARVPWRAWYLIGVLTLLEVLSFVDRGALSLMVGPVKADLHLTDTQMSYLLGLSVAIFYTTMGVPIGYLIDRMSRRNLVFAGALLWTVMTALCGVARSFGQLFVLRMGVGLGDAVLTPSGYSIARDGFPPSARGRAFSIFQLGGAFGTGAGNLVVGLLVGLADAGKFQGLPLIGGFHPWQAVLLVIGLGGIPLAFLMLTAREPARPRVTASEIEAASIRTALATLRAHWQFYVALAFMNIAMWLGLFGYIVWLPEAIARTWGISRAEAGVTLGTLQTLGSLVGFLVAGTLMDRFARRGWPGFAPLSGGILALFCGAAMALAMQVSSIVLMWGLVTAAWIGLCWATLSFPVTMAYLTPNRMMGKVSSIYNVLTGIFGGGLGATAVAIVSDRCFSGPHALPNALSVVGGSMVAINGLAQLWAARAMRGAASPT